MKQRAQRRCQQDADDRTTPRDICTTKTRSLWQEDSAAMVIVMPGKSRSFRSLSSRVRCYMVRELGSSEQVWSRFMVRECSSSSKSSWVTRSRTNFFEGGWSGGGRRGVIETDHLPFNASTAEDPKSLNVTRCTGNAQRVAPGETSYPALIMGVPQPPFGEPFKGRYRRSSRSIRRVDVLRNISHKSMLSHLPTIGAFCSEHLT